MTVLFFDTETTGIPNFRLPIDDPCQPYLVQIAGILTDDAGKVLAQLSMIVNSDVDVPEAASNVHGITRERAAALGAPVPVVLAPFFHLWLRADLVVAHNLPFDEFVLKSAITRYWGAHRTLPEKPGFCTLKASAPIVNLPATPRMLAAGIKGPKSPRLDEAYQYFFGDGVLSGAHDALVDATACMRIYFRLQEGKQAEAA